jgi:2-polyprenyl-6-methoxyphenol hydroxylase-like FAD-dependent oxidoreductase
MTDPTAATVKERIPGDAVDIRPLYMLPVGNAWEHRASATVIGVAAHLMCPWAGEGVNLAIWDSPLLAHTIIKAHETAGKDAVSYQRALDPLMTEFEVDMVARVKEKAEEALSNGQMFGEDGMRAIAEFFLRFGTAGIGCYVQLGYEV